jgi:arylsulfatase A-like enzyme
MANKAFKRVFLITVDCLRADFVSCINRGISLTPNIDRLAKDSLVFKKAFSNGPGTNQSFPAILSSTYFLLHGGMHLRPNYVTLAEILKNNGFKTAAFHSNPFLSKSLGWDKGFKEFFDFMNTIKSPSAFVTRNKNMNKLVSCFSTILGANRFSYIQHLLKKVYYKFSDFQIPYLDGKELNNHVQKWLQRNKSERFFLWMHYMDPHVPYVPPEKYLSNFSSRRDAFDYNCSIDHQNIAKKDLEILKNLYLGEVRYVDDCLGEFWRYLEEKKILDESLIILTADHGHAFMEHGKFGHAYDILYNEVLHVPLIFYGFEHFKIINVPVQLLDVPPTILKLLNIDIPPDFMGKNLLSLFNEEKQLAPIFSESARPNLINLKYDLTKKVVSCIKDPYKLITNQMKGTVELYNIEKDFEEKKNLIDRNKDIFEEIFALIQKHLTAVDFKHKMRNLRFNRTV